MKLNLSLVTQLCLCIQAIGSVSAAAAEGQLDRNDPVYRAALEKECGELGVLDVPEGFEESKVRHCREHPRFRDPTFVPDFARMEKEEKEAKLANGDRRGMRGRNSFADRAAADIFSRDKQACWYGDNQYGCKDGSCWRVCGSRGSWCWLTADNPNGPWLKCGVDSQCNFGIGVCSGGSCGSCGCGC